MKTVNTTNAQVTEVTPNKPGTLNFDDVVIYNEMADQTSVKVNLLEQIKNQMNQLEEMTSRRQFVMKEIMTYFAK